MQLIIEKESRLKIRVQHIYDFATKTIFQLHVHFVEDKKM